MTSSTTAPGMSPACRKTQLMSSFGPAMNPSSDIIVWTKTLPITTSAIAIDNRTMTGRQTHRPSSLGRTLAQTDAYSRATPRRTCTNMNAGATHPSRVALVLAVGSRPRFAPRRRHDRRQTRVADHATPGARGYLTVGCRSARIAATQMYGSHAIDGSRDPELVWRLRHLRVQARRQLPAPRRTTRRTPNCRSR